jgi:putative radical SAM enzyme (TIGR03279 family)
VPAPRIVSVTAESPADHAGLSVGDEILSIDGRVPRDVIEYQVLTDEADPELSVRRGHDELVIEVEKVAGEPLGLEVSSAVFDRVRTCDNHCDFCFIYQLPKGMRRSLYLKDDDYRLSFLYGNFTTLTRFSELDLERVIDEHLSPLYVSIHSTDPELRAHLVRNRRGATSLRWLRALLDAGITVHGQVVVCPGVNDGEALEDTMAGIAEQYSQLSTVACVPVGLSRYSGSPDVRPHTDAEANAVLDTVDEWQELFKSMLGRRLVYAADEYYLLTGRPFPPEASYEGFVQHENGIGMARAFIDGFTNPKKAGPGGVRHGFFASVDAAPAEGYRAIRLPPADHEPVGATRGLADPRPVTVLTGTYGARILDPLLAAHPRPDVAVHEVPNDFFGGNIGVAGLLTGEDLARALANAPRDTRYLLPDACLNEGRFLDGLTLADLPRAVEVVPTDGHSLRAALDGTSFRSACAA